MSLYSDFIPQVFRSPSSKATKFAECILRLISTPCNPVLELFYSTEQLEAP